MANVTAQAIARIAMSGTGISSSKPQAFRIERAIMATAMPMSAHTIQEGK